MKIFIFDVLAVLQLKEVREGRLKKLKQGVLSLWHVLSIIS
jgi:hypothetical protein